MPRPKLLRSEKRSEVVFVKLKRDERKALDTLSRVRLKAEHPNWTVSSLMREGFLLLLQQEKRKASRPEKGRKVA